MTTAEVKGLWDDAADWWAIHLRTDRNRRTHVFPLLGQLLGDVRDREVLDAGCGEGSVARLLAKAGAYVTGVDLSRLIEFARQEERKKPYGIEYVQCDLAIAHNTLTCKRFDSAICSLVLHSCPDITEVLRSLHTLLKGAGRLVVCDLHPRVVTPFSSWLYSWEPLGRASSEEFLVKIAHDAPIVPFFYRSMPLLEQTFEECGFDIETAHEPNGPMGDGTGSLEPLLAFFTLRAR